MAGMNIGGNALLKKQLGSTRKTALAVAAAGLVGHGLRKLRKPKVVAPVTLSNDLELGMASVGANLIKHASHGLKHRSVADRIRMNAKMAAPHVKKIGVAAKALGKKAARGAGKVLSNPITHAIGYGAGLNHLQKKAISGENRPISTTMAGLGAGAISAGAQLARSSAAGTFVNHLGKAVVRKHIPTTAFYTGVALRPKSKKKKETKLSTDEENKMAAKYHVTPDADGKGGLTVEVLDGAPLSLAEETEVETQEVELEDGFYTDAELNAMSPEELAIVCDANGIDPSELVEQEVDVHQMVGDALLQDAEQRNEATKHARTYRGIAQYD